MEAVRRSLLRVVLFPDSAWPFEVVNLGRRGTSETGSPRRRTFVAFLRLSISFLASNRPSSISREILTASSSSRTRFVRSSSVSPGGGIMAAVKGSLVKRRLQAAIMGREREGMGRRWEDGEGKSGSC